MGERVKSKKKSPADTSAVHCQTRENFLSGLQNLALKYDVVLLFILVCGVYNTVSRMTMSGDTNPAAFLPLSLILHHSVNFDAMIGPGLGPNVAYAFPLVNGHYFSLFPIVTPILVTPVYFISYLLFSVFQIPLDTAAVMVLAKTSATIVASLSCVVVYLVGKELFSRKTALATALIYAFATSTWSVSSQALWQHGTVELLLVLMVYCIIRNEKEPSRYNIFALGLLSGLFLFNRPPDAPLLIPVIGYVIWYERKNLAWFGTAAVLSGLPFLVYNLSVFGNIFGGYKENLGLFGFSLTCLSNFLGLLIAPNLGLLIFSPVLLLAIVGYLRLDTIANPRIRQVLLVFGPVILIEILVYSLFGYWDSSVAYSYGQRFLTGFIPVLAILTGIVIDGLFHTDSNRAKIRFAQAAVVLLIAASVGIQVIGVFFYPLYPDRSTSHEKTWDLENSTVINSLTYGVSHIDSITTYSFPPLPPLLHLQLRSPASTSPL